MKRTLTLHRDVLTELTAGELAYVVGGQITQNCQSLDFCETVPLRQCLEKHTVTTK
jgi:hypothetical protein